MTDRRCVTPEEYALERRLSVRTVYRLIKRGTVPAERVGHQYRIWLKLNRTTPDSSATS